MMKIKTNLARSPKFSIHSIQFTYQTFEKKKPPPSLLSEQDLGQYILCTMYSVCIVGVTEKCQYIKWRSRNISASHLQYHYFTKYSESIFCLIREMNIEPSLFCKIMILKGVGGNPLKQRVAVIEEAKVIKALLLA